MREAGATEAVTVLQLGTVTSGMATQRGMPFPKLRAARLGTERLRPAEAPRAVQVPVARVALSPAVAGRAAAAAGVTPG